MKKIIVCLSILAFSLFSTKAYAMEENNAINPDEPVYSITNVEENNEIQPIDGNQDIYRTTAIDGNEILETSKDINTVSEDTLSATNENGVIKVTSANDSNNILENVLFGTAGAIVGSVVTYFVINKRK